jgi:hypothetical protein
VKKEIIQILLVQLLANALKKKKIVSYCVSKEKDRSAESLG